MQQQEYYQNSPFHSYLNQSGMNEEVILDPTYATPDHVLDQSEEEDPPSDCDEVISPIPRSRSRSTISLSSHNFNKEKEKERFTELLKYSLATSALLHPHLVDALPLYPTPASPPSSATTTDSAAEQSPQKQQQQLSITSERGNRRNSIQWEQDWELKGLTWKERSPLKTISSFFKFFHRCISIITSRSSPLIILPPPPTLPPLTILPGSFPQEDERKKQEAERQKKVYTQVLREVELFVASSQKLDLKLARAISDVNFGGFGGSGAGLLSWDTLFQPSTLPLLLSDILSTTSHALNHARVALRALESNMSAATHTPVITPHELLSSDDEPRQDTFFTPNSSSHLTPTKLASSSSSMLSNSEAEETTDDDEGPSSPIRRRRGSSFAALSLRALRALGDSALPPPPTPDLHSSAFPSSSSTDSEADPHATIRLPKASSSSSSTTTSSSQTHTSTPPIPLQASLENLHASRRGLLWRLLGSVDKDDPALSVGEWENVGEVFKELREELDRGLERMEGIVWNEAASGASGSGERGMAGDRRSVLLPGFGMSHSIGPSGSNAIASGSGSGAGGAGLGLDLGGGGGGGSVRRTNSLNRGMGVKKRPSTNGGGPRQRPLSLSFASSFSIDPSASSPARSNSPFAYLPSTPTPRTRNNANRNSYSSSVGGGDYSIPRKSISPSPPSASSSTFYNYHSHRSNHVANFAPPNPNSMTPEDVKKQKWEKAVKEMNEAMRSVAGLVEGITPSSSCGTLSRYGGDDEGGETGDEDGGGGGEDDLGGEDEEQLAAVEENYGKVKVELERLVRAWEEGGVALGLGSSGSGGSRSRKRESMLSTSSSVQPRMDEEGEAEDAESSRSSGTLFETEEKLGKEKEEVDAVPISEEEEEIGAELLTGRREQVFEATVGGDEDLKDGSGKKLTREERIKKMKEKRESGEDGKRKSGQLGNGVDAGMITELRDVLGLLKSRNKLPRDFERG